jgi:hypothetical protein
MTCSFCTDLAATRNENNSSAFAAGCDNFRIETLRAYFVDSHPPQSHQLNSEEVVLILFFNL